MEKESGNTNWGCLIVVTIFVIVNLITLFSNKDNIAGVGEMIISYAVFAGIVWVVKKFSSDRSDSQNTCDNVSPNTHKPNEDLTSETVIDRKPKSNTKGCIILLIIVVVVLALLKPVLSNYEFNYKVGAIAAIAIAVGIGVAVYNSGKDY
ncbi:MAG: hypothetical protein IK005_02240 [Paludibacteraceae bacterium]|nr:hypothetical protein [Paludibacteraceae bacterium]